METYTERRPLSAAATGPLLPEGARVEIERALGCVNELVPLTADLNLRLMDIESDYSFDHDATYLPLEKAIPLLHELRASAELCHARLLPVSKGMREWRERLRCLQGRDVPSDDYYNLIEFAAAALRDARDAATTMVVQLHEWQAGYAVDPEHYADWRVVKRVKSLREEAERLRTQLRREAAHWLRVILTENAEEESDG
jgi:hypothetical protein